MPRVTDLIYLERDTAAPWPSGAGARPRSTGGRSARRPRPSSATVLQATYAGSLDMPELEGIRSLDDVMASHRAAGRFVADRWRVGRLAGRARRRGGPAPLRDPRPRRLGGRLPRPDPRRPGPRPRPRRAGARPRAGRAATSPGSSWPSTSATTRPAASTAPPASSPSTAAPSTWPSWRGERTGGPVTHGPRTASSGDRTCRSPTWRMMSPSFR